MKKNQHRKAQPFEYKQQESTADTVSTQQTIDKDSLRNERYSRQILFSGIGEAGQKKLSEKHVLIIGVGALGTSNAEILSRAGVGTLTIVDRDYIEFSNLQRQQLFTEQNALDRLPKAFAAKQRLQEINSSTTIHAEITDVNTESLERLATGVDLILDATDNFETRLLINDVSHKLGIPWIYGACVSSYGISMAILPGETPCLHCLLETVPTAGAATCDTAGIIAPTVQMVISHQSAEALKILTENFEQVHRKLVSFDLWSNQYTKINVGAIKKPDCPTCGDNPTYPFLQWENQMKTAVLCGRNTVQIRPSKMFETNLHHIKEQMERLEIPVMENPFLISFTVENHRIVLFQDGRALIHDTKDVEVARTLYHRYIGA